MRIFFVLLFFSNPLFSFSQISTTKGLIAYYPFNGNAKDETGNNNNAVFNNATLTSDKNGNAKSAYSFNGKNQYIRINNSSSLKNMTTQITISCNVKVNGFYKGKCHWNRIINKGSDYASGNYWLGFCDDAFSKSACVENIPDETHQTFHGSSFFEDWGSGKANAFVKTGIWYTVTYTCDGIYNKLYVDCQLIDSWKATTNGVINNEDLFFGKLDNPQYPYWFNGVLDDVRIYNRALSSNEILELCEKNETKNTIPDAFAEISYSIEKCNKINVELANAVQIKSVKWQIDNLYNSTKEKFSYTFKKEGSYTIKLTYTGNNGIINTISKEIIITKPTADFTIKNTSENKYSFKTISKEKANLLWNFGDGTVEKNSKNISHTYLNSGSYTVSLIAIDKNGCSDTTIQNITIAPLIANKNIELNGDNGNIQAIKSNDVKALDFLPEKRMNTFIQQIEVLNDSIEISFYDNGTIDGDSITVQFNNKIITQHLLLTATGKSFYIKIDPAPATNELIMFAENLGSIPPNTALMIIYDGKKRHEINIKSSKTNNGMVSFVLKK
ncbi:PKD domain-containing protein [Ferruginibacter yonginensis]|uniref:PKD domain-containing protein n=1 Tax=Ferruginibacter yonginensis TaxID=1310416 RepID=A0ABV8QPT8_9BACT